MNILIADDEDVVCEVIEDVLTLSGYSVSAHADGTFALADFETNLCVYDLVILDVMMPEMGGPEVARAIRKTSDVPIIMISGYDVNVTLDLLKGISGIEFMQKPFSPTCLIEQVEALFERAGSRNV